MSGLDSSKALTGIPAALRTPLVDEFNKLVRHYREGRWEPAELNGGKLCEIVYSILRGHVDNRFPSRPSKPRNMVDACRAFENETAFPRSVRFQIPKMLISLYEVRNNRNVGHVGADVDPNHMDATVVLSITQWIMAELVRLFHTVSTEEATEIVNSLVDRTFPLLWKVGDKVRILDPNMSAKDKCLALIYGSIGPQNVRFIVDSIEYSNITQFKIKVLKPMHKSKLIEYDRKNESVSISPLGTAYVEKNILPSCTII
ncbi:hypothetical protein JI743_03320 [Sphingopyxis sp. DHUNG17]|uniref:hypothetical protein n=1 Tax=Sphingopyxis jiangsuensis TaxID=2871171 RepID=UPI00191D0427|nr:hypothetical protein [Sphingopyxis lutea]MBL0767829.1 hypothetical protein [Sphingopyxis lutea]